MRARVLTAAGVAAALSALAAGGAGASPGAAYTASCVDGGLTTVSWSHLRVTRVTFAWFDANGAPMFEPVPVEITKRAPHGSAFASTVANGNVVPASATVTLLHADGTQNELPAGCS